MFWTVVLEKILEGPLDTKETQPVLPKGNQSWIFIGRTDAEAETLNTLATWCEELTHLKKTLMLEKIEGGRSRGWQRMRWLDGITTQWTWVWVSSGSWWWTGKPGVLQSMGSQRVRHYWARELNWTDVWSCVPSACPTRHMLLLLFPLYRWGNRALRCSVNTYWESESLWGIWQCYSLRMPLFLMVSPMLHSVRKEMLLINSINTSLSSGSIL